MHRMPFRTLLTSFVLLPVSLWGQANPLPGQANPMTPDPNGPRPIAAKETVWLEEMTWMEVRDALRAGKRRIVIPTGGVEQNGPYLAAGKHNYILRGAAEAIARKYGNCLVAPIVPFVPEGDIHPPAGHMKYPSTISLTQDTFERLLTDIAASLKQHGFEEIFLLGDSGGNVKGMANVASRLSGQWAGGRTRIAHIAEFYDYAGVKKWLEGQGIREGNDGIHDDYAITAQMMAIDPSAVRMQERQAKGLFQINGVALAPADKTIAMGRRIFEYRAGVAVAAMRKAMAPKK